jgi:hypothetical protein
MPLSKKLSPNMAKVYAASHQEHWMTSRQLADKAKVSERNARHHALRFVHIGLFEVRKMTEYYYLRSADPSDPGYVEELKEAARVINS